MVPNQPHNFSIWQVITIDGDLSQKRRAALRILQMGFNVNYKEVVAETGRACFFARHHMAVCPACVCLSMDARDQIK